MKKILTARIFPRIISEYFNKIEEINKEIYQQKEVTPDNKKINFIKNLRDLINKNRKIDSTLEKLVKNVKSEPEEIHMSTFNKNDLPKITKKYGFPKELSERLKLLVFSNQGNTFDFPIFEKIGGNIPTSFILREYLGIVQKDAKTVFFAFISTKVKAEALIKTKLPLIHVEMNQRKFYCDIQRIGYTANELNAVRKILESYSSDSLYQKIDSMMKSQTLLYQSVPMTVNNYKAVINSNGLMTIKNTKDGKTTSTIGKQADTFYAPYSLQLGDNGSLSIVNKYYEATSLLFAGSKGIGPFTLSISDNGKLILIDSQKKEVYRSP